ncbi:hypothetical protein [Micromonospora sp. IBHARD004]|uniref:hypothetical protein n=1 Tax=Micromonospora sp. IBHARD004 TaxID=3457764 RepID=UPI00405A3235
MSNRKKLRRTSPVSMLFRSQDGARIPGGCDTCNAYQVLQADHHGPNLHCISVHHDDWCPTYNAMKVTAR